MDIAIHTTHVHLSMIHDDNLPIIDFGQAAALEESTRIDRPS